MSDPVTNAEVEDVLSSIRRLVSQDKRPQNRARADAPREDKLVLTPSLRVSNDAPLKDAYKPQPQPVDWAEDPSEDATALRGSDAFETSGRDTGQDDTEDAHIENMLVGDPDDDDFNLMDDAESAEDEGRRDWQAPIGEAVDPGLDAEDDLAPSDPPKSVSYDRPDILNLGASELVEDATPTTSDRLSAKIAALESAISRIPENYEPDAPGEGDYSGSEAPAMAWEDDVDLDATGAPMQAAKRPDPAPRAPAAAAPKPNTAMYFEDEDGFEESFEDGQYDDEDTDQAADGIPAMGLGGDEYLDEEMLRDLVSEIVRSELQGALGERITRNVRKLVRREIHRALTAKDLE